jgi:hypothetical protein
VLLGKGDGTFQNPVNYATGTNPTALAVGDVNRDGKLGNGGGTFQSPSYVAGQSDVTDIAMPNSTAMASRTSP